MQNLVKQIVEEQNKIDEELAQEDENLAFYRDFFTKYHTANMSDIIKIPKVDLLVAFLGSKKLSQPIDKIKDTIYSNSSFFERVKIRDIKEIVELIIDIDQAKLLPKVIENLHNGVRTTKLGRLLSDECKYTEELAKLAEKFDTTPKNLAKVVRFIVDDINICFSSQDEGPLREFTLLEAINYADVLEQFKDDLAQNKEFLEEMGYVGHNKLKGKAYTRAMRDLAKSDGWQLDNLYNEAHQIRRYYDEINDKKIARNKTLTRTRGIYENLLTQLFQAMEQKDRELKVPTKILSKVPNEEIRNATLREIYKHNLVLCEAKEQEYAEVSANASSHYQVLLANYGISPNQYEVGTVLHQSLADIEAILKSLTGLGITEPKMLLTAAQISDISTIKNYTSLAEKGIITKNLLVEHPNLLNTRSKEYENMMRNLATAKQYNINPHYFTATEEVLLTPAKNFSTNIETLNSYQLTSAMKTCLDISFLTAPDLTTAIDTLLELGLETNLESNLELLNHRDRFNRLRILKELNIPLTSTDQVLEVLTTDKFYIPDSLISDYIYNAVDHTLPENITLLDAPKKKLPDLTRLEEYSQTPRTYNFNGVTISKNRVARNLELVKATGNVDERLMYSILKGATLNDNEVTKIKTALTPTEAVPIKNKKS